MSVVALRLAGPLQSWGSSSRFVRRGTERAPTKSGVLGLVAAAKGLRRTDPLEDLLKLRLGVRIDQPGQLVRDFQTARMAKRERNGTVKWVSLPLSYRYYMGDAVYLAVLEGDRALCEGIDAAVRRPAFPLYLGRRACPPSLPIALGVFDLDIDAALRQLPWQASPYQQRRRKDRTVSLETVRDTSPDDPRAETTRDEPVSFDPNRRLYRWRPVIRDHVLVENPYGTAEPAGEHDPMPMLEG